MHLEYTVEDQGGDKTASSTRYESMTETYHQQHVSLNTPIAKIRNLNLNSSPVDYDIHEYQPDEEEHHQRRRLFAPQETQSSMFILPTQPQAPTNLYPSLDLQKSPTESSMLNKGYSHKLTNNVLSELHMRAQQITTTTTNAGQHGSDGNSNTSPLYGLDDQVSQRRNKRYSGIHMSKFKQMESISHHYSVHNGRNKTPSPQKLDNLESGVETGSITGHGEGIESASKRRRTLNGKNEVLAIPIMHQQENRQPPQNPTDHRKISPSKASYNLNSILRETTDTGSPNKETWSKPLLQPPKVPQLKKRPSSLEMAGVINSSPTRYNDPGLGSAAGSGALKSLMLHMDKPMSNSNVLSLLKEPLKLNDASGLQQSTESNHHLLSRPGTSRSFVKPLLPQQ